MLRKLDRRISSYESARTNLLSVEEFTKRSSFLRSWQKKKDFGPATDPNGAATGTNNQVDASCGVVFPRDDTPEHPQSPSKDDDEAFHTWSDISQRDDTSEQSQAHKHDASVSQDVLLESTNVPASQNKKRAPEPSGGNGNGNGDGDGPLGSLKASCSHQSSHRDLSGSNQTASSAPREHTPDDEDNSQAPAAYFSDDESSPDDVSQNSSPCPKRAHSLKRASDDPKLGTPVAAKRQVSSVSVFFFTAGEHDILAHRLVFTVF